MINPVLFLSQPTSSPPVSQKSAVMRPRRRAYAENPCRCSGRNRFFFHRESSQPLRSPRNPDRTSSSSTPQPSQGDVAAEEESDCEQVQERFRRRSIPPPKIPERRSRGEGTRPDFSLSPAPSHFLPIWSAHTNVFLFLRTPFLFVAPCYFL